MVSSKIHLRIFPWNFWEPKVDFSRKSRELFEALPKPSNFPLSWKNRKDYERSRLETVDKVRDWISYSVVQDYWAIMNWVLLVLFWHTAKSYNHRGRETRFRGTCFIGIVFPEYVRSVACSLSAYVLYFSCCLCFVLSMCCFGAWTGFHLPWRFANVNGAILDDEIRQV
jgi:hypothetical protein